MGNQPTTEHDLRDALRTLVPDDLDATDFRARLDRLLVGDQPAAPHPGTAVEAVEVVELAALQPAGRRQASRGALVMTMAACAAAVFTIALVVVHGHADRRTPPPPAVTAPVAVRSLLFPGTIVLHTYTGQGSRTFAVGRHTVPAHFGYAAYGTCRGAGNLTVAQQVIMSACHDPQSAFGTNDVIENGRLAITADPRTAWQITLAIAPDARTNGSVQGPIDADLSGPDNELRQSGHGSATARFGSEILGEDPSKPLRYRLRLVCHGAGVSLPGLTSERAKGLQTRTCFAGREYVWDELRLTLPTTVRVVAPAGTTWTIVVEEM